MVIRLHKPILKHPAQFIARLSTLLQEGYTFEESIHILSPYHVEQLDVFHATLAEAFLQGHTPTEILSAMGIKKRFLFSIVVAQSTGDLAYTLKKISEDMLFYEQTRERMKRLLYYPAFLFVFVTILFIAYRQLFLPRMETLLYNRGSNDVKSLKLSQLFLNVPDYMAFTLIILLVILAILGYILSRKEMATQQRIYSSLPFIGPRFKEIVTQRLARELGNLLLHGFSLQEALAILATQQHQKFVALIARQLETHVKNGEALSTAVRNNDFLLKRFEQFVVHGEHSGMLGRELLLFSELLDEKLQSTINTLLKIVQPTLLAIIALCVLAAYLSILLPIYNMIEFV